MDIGQKITYYRTLLNLTQVQVARSLGISRSAVNGWEMGFSVPQLKHVVALSGLFGISVDSLVIGEDNRTVVDISSLSSEEQALVLQLVRCLSSKNNSTE